MKLCTGVGIGGDKAAFAQTMRLLRQVGFETLDVDLGSSFFAQDNAMQQAREYAHIIAENGLAVKYTHLPFDYPAPQDTAAWEAFEEACYRAMDVTKEFGADSTAIHPCTAMTTDYDRDREFEHACRFLQPFADYAKRIGVKLGLENMRGAGWSAPQKVRRFCTDVDDLIAVADAMGTGIVWDTGHGNISMQAQKQSLLKIGKRLTHIHVDDNFCEDDIHVIPFLGKVQWNDFIAGLAALDYSGDMNLELNTGEHLPAGMREPFLALMAASGKALIEMFLQQRNNG